MMKVLLIDDEPYILKGLQQIINWENEGFEIMGMANNGVQALSMINAEDYDIIISDIKMPEMTGLDLLKTIKEKNLSDASIILLSGYDDFEYAKTAIKYEAVEYILKPVESGELLHALDRAKKIRNDKVNRDYLGIQHQRNEFAKNLSSLLKRNNDFEGLDYVRNKIGECKGARYISVFINTQAIENTELSDQELKSYQKLLFSKCISLIGNEFRCITDVMIDNNKYDVGIIFSNDLIPAGKSEKETLVYLRETLTNELDSPIKMIIGTKVEDISRISDSFKSVALAGFLYNVDISFVGKIKNDEEDDYLPQFKMDDLIHAIEIKDSSQIKEFGEQMYSYLISSPPHIVNITINHFLYELMELATHIDSNVDQEEVIKNISESILDDINSDSNKDSFMNMLLEFSDYLSQLRSVQSVGVLVSVENYIRENYMENLTLKDLGQMFFINSAYLGQLFKAQYSMGFKDYLHQLRINKAEELLIKTDMKVFEIAESVGYKDMEYFINHFIAQKGCTPTRYKKRLKGK